MKRLALTMVVNMLSSTAAAQDEVPVTSEGVFDTPNTSPFDGGDSTDTSDMIAPSSDGGAAGDSVWQDTNTSPWDGGDSTDTSDRVSLDSVNSFSGNDGEPLQTLDQINDPATDYFGYDNIEQRNQDREFLDGISRGVDAELANPTFTDDMARERQLENQAAGFAQQDLAAGDVLHEQQLQAIAEGRLNDPSIPAGMAEQINWTLDHANTVEAVQTHLQGPIGVFSAAGKFGKEVTSLGTNVHDHENGDVVKWGTDLAYDEGREAIASQGGTYIKSDDGQRALYYANQTYEAYSYGQDLSAAAKLGPAGVGSALFATMEHGAGAYNAELKELERQQLVKGEAFDASFNAWYGGLSPAERQGTELPASFGGQFNGASANGELAAARFRINQAVEKYPEKFPSYNAASPSKRKGE